MAKITVPARGIDLKFAREIGRLTQQELASRARLAASTVARFEQLGPHLITCEQRTWSAIENVLRRRGVNITTFGETAPQRNCQT